MYTDLEPIADPETQLMVGAHGALGVPVVHLAVVANSSARGSANERNVRDRRKAHVRVTRNPAKESGAVGLTGVHAPFLVVLVAERERGIACQRTNVSETQSNMMCANFLAVTVSTTNL